MTDNVDKESTPDMGTIIDPVISAHFEGIGSEKASVAEVFNLVDKPLDISASLNISGMMKYNAEMKLGEFILEPKETKVLAVKATEFPIQVASGFGNIAPRVVARIPKKTGTVEWIAPMRSIFYQHKKNYRNVEAFIGMKTLMSRGGHVGGIAHDEKINGQILGRLKKTNGVFEEVRAQRSMFGKTDENGQQMGYVTGVDISIGRDEEISSINEEVKQ